jgi:hypothetical protein
LTPRIRSLTRLLAVGLLLAWNAQLVATGPASAADRVLIPASQSPARRNPTFPTCETGRPPSIMCPVTALPRHRYQIRRCRPSRIHSRCRCGPIVLTSIRLWVAANYKFGSRRWLTFAYEWLRVSVATSANGRAVGDRKVGVAAQTGGRGTSGKLARERLRAVANIRRERFAASERACAF